MKYQHIHISELKPGMHVVDPGLRWQSHPYLYMKDCRITCEEEVRSIMAQGYLEVCVEPLPAPDTRPPSDMESLLEDIEVHYTRPTVTLQEELSMACQVHDESVAYVHDFMNDARAGKLDIEPAARLIDGIVESIGRNADALLTISRLRRTDSYTYMHCVNVSMLTAMLARYTGLGEQEVFLYGLAGIFHDIGKSMVPTEILNAPRKLTETERRIINFHPALGAKMLSKVPNMPEEVIQGTLHHHEKQNGSGYPGGVASDGLSRVGCTVAIADVYDALTSRRVYKEAMYAARALGIMYKLQGAELHSELLLRFIRMLGVYPVGSIVEMRDASRGVVSASNPEHPLRPEVILVRDPQGRPIPPEHHDLARAGSLLEIARSIPDAESDIDPVEVLGISGQA